MTKELKRVFYLNDLVEDKTVKDIIKDLRETLAHDKKQSDTLKEYKPEPIQLFIDSYGGYIYDGLALANLLNESETPIHTHCYGKAMSMGLYLFLCGDLRYVHEDATLMYHQLSSGAWGKHGDLVIAVEQKTKLHKMLTKRVKAKLTDKGRKLINRSNKEKSDWYLSGKEALKYGFATDVISYKNKKGDK